MKNNSLLIVTTVPITLQAILRHQPRYLSDHYNVELATSPGYACEEIELDEGVKVHPVSMRRGISPLHDLVAIWSMIKVIRKVRPDVIHSYTPKAGLVSMAAAWLCRVPVRIHTFTGLLFPTETGFKQRILLLVDSLICRLATKVIPEGEGVKRDLLSYGVTQKPLQIIGYGNIAGVDTSFFSKAADSVSESSKALKSSLGVKEGDFVFCFVGRLHPDKGISELLSAFIVQNDNAKLLLVGGEDEVVPLCNENRRILHENRRVFSIGFLRDIRPALAMSDILVLPSYREGFPNVVLQAGAMELPVIATDISGSNEVIESGNNGWLVPARDAVKLGDAMGVAYKTSPDRRREMGRVARQRIQARYERQDHWQRMVGFYNKELASC